MAVFHKYCGVFLLRICQNEQKDALRASRQQRVRPFLHGLLTAIGVYDWQQGSPTCSGTHGRSSWLVGLNLYNNGDKNKIVYWYYPLRLAIKWNVYSQCFAVQSELYHSHIRPFASETADETSPWMNIKKTASGDQTQAPYIHLWVCIYV